MQEPTEKQPFCSVFRMTRIGIAEREWVVLQLLKTALGVTFSVHVLHVL